MTWKTVIGALVALGSVMLVVVKKRRPEVQTLGSVSTTWIAEHHSNES